MACAYKGIVQKGKGVARTLGFATINIPLEDTSISGIYAANVRVQDTGGRYGAAVYANPERGVLEAHLLDFDGDLDGRQVQIELVKRMRESREFEDEKSLRDAIAKDVEHVRAFFDEQHV